MESPLAVQAETRCCERAGADSEVVKEQIAHNRQCGHESDHPKTV
jgi:hypothetical protein